MKAVLTKVFHFSASYEKDHKIFASNYRLGVTTAALDESEEAVFEKKIQESLIQEIHSRDLSLHVDFLKGKRVTEHQLLQSFADRIKKEIAPWPLFSLSLERDERTKITLSLE